MPRPTFPRGRSNSWKSYHRPTAKGTVSLLQPSDGMVLVIGPRLEGHSFIFLAIQTHPSCRFHGPAARPGHPGHQATPEPHPAGQKASAQGRPLCPPPADYEIRPSTQWLGGSRSNDAPQGEKAQDSIRGGSTATRRARAPARASWSNASLGSSRWSSACSPKSTLERVSGFPSPRSFKKHREARATKMFLEIIIIVQKFTKSVRVDLFYAGIAVGRTPRNLCSSVNVSLLFATRVS